MADATKTTKTAAAAAAEDELADIEAAITPKPRQETATDRAIAAARDAELKRQADIEAAVAKAGADELPKLGGSLNDPGLGR